MYAGSATLLVSTIVSAIETDDAESAAMAAHSLKSSSVNVGALALASLCETIEQLAGERRLVKARQWIDELRRQHLLVDAAIADLRKS